MALYLFKKNRPKMYTEQQMQDALYKLGKEMWQQIPYEKRALQGTLSGYIIRFYEKMINK